MTLGADYELLAPTEIADPALQYMEQRALEVYGYDIDRDDAGQFEIRRQFVKDFCTFLPMARRPRRPLSDRPLRVGYIGSDFFSWSGNWIFGPIILGHSAAVEAYCYNYSRMVPSYLDPATALYQATTRWRDIGACTAAEAAEQIDTDEIDILVDLMGYSFGLPLTVLMYKPAPVQVTAWGHVSGGTGLSTVDYLFADPIACPQAIRAHYTERILDLPCIIRYTPPVYLPRVGRSVGRPFRFYVPHRFRKVTERAVRCWAEILRRVPDAELMIKSIDIPPTDEGRARVCWQFRNVPDDISRRILITSVTSPLEHLKFFWDADVVLDTLPFNGGVVSMESLAMGVPFVTRMGEYLAARVGGSILHQVGMDDWVTDTDEAYIDRAVHAADERDRLPDRSELRNRLFQSPLCTQDYVQRVEEHYRRMVAVV